MSRNGKIPRIIKARTRIKDAAKAGVKLARAGVGKVKAGVGVKSVRASVEKVEAGVEAVEVTAEGARVECRNSASGLRTERLIWKPGENTRSR